MYDTPYNFPSPYELPSTLSETSKRRRSTATRRRQGEFLAGPIPLRWLTRATYLPGKALAVGVAIWFKSRVSRSDTVKISRPLMKKFHVGRGATARCLKALESAGLITVERQRRRPRWTTRQRRLVTTLTFMWNTCGIKGARATGRRYHQSTL